jgi:hypothetical protein
MTLQSVTIILQGIMTWQIAFNYYLTHHNEPTASEKTNNGSENPILGAL